MAYVTVAEYKDYMQSLTASMPVAMTADEDAFYLTCLEEATQFIESETKRRFTTGVGVRYYDRRAVPFGDPQLLLLDEDLLSVTTLTNADGNVVTSDKYWLEPANVLPAYGIRLKSTTVWAYNTDGRISVSGGWGFMATPNDDVKRVTMRLAYVFQQRRAATDDVQIVSQGVDLGGTLRYGSAIPSDIRDWLRRFRRDKYGWP